MWTVLLPPCVNPIAVKYIYIYIYHIISYQKHTTLFTGEKTLHVEQIVNTEHLQKCIPRKMGCFRYIIVNTVHKGDNTDYYAHNNNNNSKDLTEEQTVSKGLWQPPSPDLSTCDFYLWEYLKGKFYESNPHTLDELKKNIRSAVETIEVTYLLKA
jgi:hypothetical protein